MTLPAQSSTSLSTDDHDTHNALITQLCVGPDFREVAATLLRRSLKTLYPDLNIEPTTAMVGTCVWEITEDKVIAAPTHFQALTEILAFQAVLGVPSLYIEGEHFLTQQPMTEPAVHLPVRIAEIATLINLLAPLMLRAFQEQQLAYWNNTNGKDVQWRKLSDSLRTLWNVTEIEGWDADDCRMARKLFFAPDLATRKLDDPYDSRAYLIKIDQGDGKAVNALNEMMMAVLIGTHAKRQIILTYSLFNGYKKYSSLEDLGAELPGHLNPALLRKEIQWRLFEPDGNFFDQQACALISMQLDTIGAMDFSTVHGADLNKPPMSLPPRTETLVEKKGPGLTWYLDLLPDWLRSASTNDLTFYSRHLKDLSALHSQNSGKSWQDDILPITQYANKALKDAMTKDHATAAQLELEDVEIQVKSPVIWGTFSVPGKTEIRVFSLAELALQNLIALPLGSKTLRSIKGNNLPTWMTVDYIETLITKLDIGSSYPALIKDKLLGNATESARRQALYSRHLQIQLPLLALQNKMSNGAIDERGYRYMAAIMQADASDRQVEGQTIVMRPLAFVPKRRTSGDADVVANMFVIGPQDPAAGPCLLYRPLLDEPLTQFPSPTNVLYAIQQSAGLRASVLAWLPDAVRSDYQRYVFAAALPSPWAVVEFAVDTSKLWTMSGPIGLGESVVEGDLFAHLFKANANALIELSDQQSVTNAESRWATFKNTGWMILGCVLPFLGRTAGVAFWIWQVLDDLEQFVEANKQGKKAEQWAALTDVFLNLAMAITLHIASRNESDHRPARETPKVEPSEPTAPVEAPVVIKQLPDLSGDLQSGHSSTLHSSGALSRTTDSLNALLDTFKISKPVGLPDATTREGAHRHLYPLKEKWYAPLGERWFEVAVDENDVVHIVDSKQTSRRGPSLVNNAKDDWTVDKNLLMGGKGLKLLEERAKDQAEIKVAELRTKLSTFEKNKKAAQRQLQQTEKEMADAPKASVEEKRTLYVKKLEDQRDGYEGALQKVKSLAVLSPIPDYQERSIGYLKAQIDLTQAGITETLKIFTPKLKTVLNQITVQAESPNTRNIEDAKVMGVMTQDMIDRLEYMQSRFTQFKKLGDEGVSLLRSARAQLPGYTIDQLKALQVTLSRNLLLPAETITTQPDAWSFIDQIIDKANITIQSLDDTLFVRSESRLDERIDSLSSLFEQFNVIKEQLLDFQTEFASVVLADPLTKLQRQIETYNKRTLRNLALLLDERITLRSRSTPRPLPPVAKLKIIRTLYDGVITGVPRLTPLGLESDLVDITSPLTNKVIATFHEKTPGVWTKRVEPPAAKTPDLHISVAAGQVLLDGLAAFNTRVTALTTQPGRTPSGVEQLLHQHAMRFKQASSDIEQALTDRNLTEVDSVAASEVKSRLETAAGNLYTQARGSMLKMAKEQPPTPFAVEWLNLNNEITIKKTVSRRKIKGSTPDYMDEYTISERKPEKILWYAHFHYSTSWTAAKMFISARLKTVAERRLGTVADTTKGLRETQLAAFYRSEIGLDLAERMFFRK